MSVPLRANENTFERAELLDAATGPADDRAQGVVGHSNRNPELMAHAFVQPAQQCPSTGQHDASVEDVAGELGRAHIQRGPDQLDDLQHQSLDRAAHFWRGDGDRVGQPGREVASCDRMLSSSRKGNAEPAPTLMSLALRSPSRREYSLLTWLMIASSISSPPRRSDLELTMPPRLMTATSVVRHRCPPPCSRRCR